MPCRTSPRRSSQAHRRQAVPRAPARASTTRPRCGFCATCRAAAARAKAVYDIDYYFVGDEGSLGSYADPVDFCFGPHTLARFRGWLQERYGSLEALNRSWTSDFAAWDATSCPDHRRGARRAAASRRGPTTARTWRRRSRVRTRRSARRSSRATLPATSRSPGTQVTTPWNGCDWHRLDGIVDDFLSYSGGNQWEIHRSFAKPGARVGFWTGYGRSGAAVKHEVWSAALERRPLPEPLLEPVDRQPRPDVLALRSRPRCRLPGPALRGHRPAADGGGAPRPTVSPIHYSMPSVHAAGDPRPARAPRRRGRSRAAGRDFPGDRDGWVRIAAATSASRRTSWPPSRWRRAALRPARLRPALLAGALGPARSRRSARFVEGGGVAARGRRRPGSSTSTLNWRAAGALDAVRDRGTGAVEARAADGARRAARSRSRPRAGRGGSRPADSPASSRSSRGSGDDGEPLLSVGATDALVVRRVGPGWVVYLNALLDRYAGVRGEPVGEAYRVVLDRVLAHARRAAGGDGRRRGRPAAAPRARSRATASARRRRGGPRRRPRCRHALRRRRGRRASRRRREAALAPPRRRRAPAAHGRGRRERAHAASRTAGPTPCDPRFFRARRSSSPPDRRGRAVDRRRRRRRGSASTSPSRSGPATGRHLVRCHVLGPDGAFRPEYAKNLLVEEGAGRFVLPSALYDLAGEYRVVATDVLTGARAEAKVTLR